MHLLLLALRLATSAAHAPDVPQHRLWVGRVEACLAGGEAAVLAADEAAEVVAFSCGRGDRRLVVMANGSEAPQRVSRAPMPEPLVPVFATRGDVATIPSLLITLFESGGVAYSNEIPPRTAVVFRPAEPEDVRPKGLEE